MKVFADASFLLARYRATAFTAQAEKIQLKHSFMLYVTPLTRLETVRALARDADSDALATFRRDLVDAAGIRAADVDSWQEGFTLAETLSVRTGKRLKTGAADSLVVA